MEKKQIVIRSAKPSDARFMKFIAEDCPAAPRWTEQQYDDLFRHTNDDRERLILVAQEVVQQKDSWKIGQASTPVRTFLGFLVARHVVPEWELENIVVTPAAQRTGIGGQLLDALIAKARQRNGESVFLEVRESNAAARSLYEKAGFAQTGRRKAYYTNPDEDALLYRLKLT
jgi:ribosomal-protein-alanine acetyltransferase